MSKVFYIQHCLDYYFLYANFPHEENLPSSRSCQKKLARKIQQLREENSSELPL